MNTLINKVYDIPIKDIEISNFNVRTREKKAGIKDLAQSIKKYGLIQPIVIMGKYNKPPYQLIVGQRRYFACKDILNHEYIKAILIDEIDEMKGKILSLVENWQRLELQIADKSEAINFLYKAFNKSIKKVADEIGCSPSTVREYVSIEDQATKKGKQYLKDNKIKKEDLKRVITAAQGNSKKADILLDEILKLSLHEKKRLPEVGKKYPGASAEVIVDISKKPVAQPNIVVPLSFEIDKALKIAQNELQMDREEVAMKAITEWLIEKGFLNSLEQ